MESHPLRRLSIIPPKHTVKDEVFFLNHMTMKRNPYDDEGKSHECYPEETRMNTPKIFCFEKLTMTKVEFDGTRYFYH